MKIEIDQSGKIEQTSKATIIAFSNNKTYVIKVQAKTKRQIQEVFRRRGHIRLFVYRTFAAAVFLLVRDYLHRIDNIIIDEEYPGHDKLIKDILLELIRKYQLKEPSISFRKIGNKPKVHYAAYDVFSRKKKENKLVKFGELVRLAIKNDRGLKRLKNA